MRVRHHIQAVGVCPNNALPDQYDVFVYTTNTVMCETLAATVDTLLARPTYQEAFTQALANALACKVRTRCPHCDRL